MTKYLQPSFSVSAPGTEQYRRNWDAIFKKKECAACTGTGKLVYRAAGGEISGDCPICEGSGQVRGVDESD